MSYPIAFISAHPSLMENISFIAVGFVFVVLVLGILSVVTFLIGKLIRGFLPAAPAPVAPPAPAKATPPAASTVQQDSGDEAIPARILAIITAAVHVTLQGRPQRIVGVRSAPQQHWAQEGRRQIFSSHKVR